MKKATRLVLTLCAFIAGYFFTYWVPFSFIPGASDITLLPQLVSLFIGVSVAAFTWRKTWNISPSLATSILLGGVIVGAVGFVAGFFAPMIFFPQSNLGPLFGIFFSGPIGFIVGLIAGGLYWMVKKKKNAALP
jgi:hypothetical protein